MKSLKVASTLCASLLLSQGAFAHTINIGWQDNLDATMTFWSSSNHTTGSAQGVSGVSIGGTLFNFDTGPVAQSTAGWNAFAAGLDGSLLVNTVTTIVGSMRSVTLDASALATAGIVGGLNSVFLTGFGSTATWTINSGEGSTVRIAFASSVPEPATLALLGIGLAGMGFARRRKKV